MTTTPDSVTYYDPGYGILGPVPPGWVSVLETGADPTGVDDSTDAFEEAVANIPNGGRLVIPPGDYVISRGIALPSNTLVTGSGWSTRIIVAAGFVNPATFDLDVVGGYSIFYNENFTVDTITDTNITIRDIFFDDSNNPLHGAFHHIRFRSLQNGRVENCRFLYGGDAVAIQRSSNVWVVGCYGEWIVNAFWDAWDECNYIYYMNNYSLGNGTAQHANFNSVFTSSSTDHASANFVCTGNIFEDEVRSVVLIEPLASGVTNTVKGAVFANNVCIRVSVFVRGVTTGVNVAGNVFREMPGPGSVISVNALGSAAPSSVSIAGNTIVDPIHSTGFGVIRCEVDGASVVGNTITGTGYAGFAGIYTGSTLGVLVAGNRVSSGIVTAPQSVAQDTEWHVGNGVRFGTYDNTGHRVDMRVQTADNNLIWVGRGASAERTIMTMVQGDDVSGALFYPPLDIGAEQNSYTRISGNSDSAVGPVIAVISGVSNTPLRLSPKGTSPVVITQNGLAFTNSAGPRIAFGTGTPEAAVTAPVGSLFLRTDGGASTTLYVKESGSGTTGWVAK